MNFVSSLCSKSATYHTPDATIIFTKSWFGWGALSVRIETARLSIRSVSKADLNNCANLFSNREVVKLYGTGQTKTYEETASRLNLWVKRWKSQDPYSGMAVFERSSGAFVGLAILGHSAAPGISELAGLGFPSFWNQGYGIETTKAFDVH
jgi:RimJ/RimL family protein N-acetyltransferase